MTVILKNTILKNTELRSWTPSDTTVYAWYDFSDSSKVTLNGSTISQLDDKSGNDYHVTQGAAAFQPLYVTAEQNGRNVAYFDDDANKFMSVDSTNFNFPVTCFVVCKWDDDGPAARIALGNYSGRGELQADSVAGVFLYNGAVGVIASPATRLNWGLYNYEISSALEKYWVNGGSEGSANAGNTTNVWDGTVIGGYSGSGFNMQGYIGEVIICEGGLLESTRKNIENYLLSKWGI